jgi:hypothetical protein
VSCTTAVINEKTQPHAYPDWNSLSWALNLNFRNTGISMQPRILSYLLYTWYYRRVRHIGHIVLSFRLEMFFKFVFWWSWSVWDLRSIRFVFHRTIGLRWETCHCRPLYRFTTKTLMHFNCFVTTNVWIIINITKIKQYAWHTNTTPYE